jgi:hypothetical protein
VNPLLRAIPKLCFAVATLLFLIQSYLLVRGTIRGYDYGFAVDLTRDMLVQYVMIWLKVAVNALVWVAFGLLARLLIRAIDNLNSVRSAIAAESSEAA